ncbi:MAG: hypothetical protein IE933_07740 [Sphingomonadales bacterium]|nr:hypothetical protein [Sphingomonadales bacterium]MBD3773801.1 hypothetical protein [Paracoccaceae bacterium]
MHKILPAALACLVAPSLALAHSPAAPDAVDIVDRAAAERGDRSPVLVLGTTHLSGLPDGFDLTRFAPLVDRLAAWKPDAIAIEALTGAQCDYLRSHEFAFPGTAQDYCYDPTAARAALGLTGPQAEEESERLLAAPVQVRPAAERRHLAALFLAQGDPSSAMVQWLRLPPEERVAGDGLTADLVAALDKRMRSRNENIVIAATLAARLGHERVYPVDDHTGDRASGPGDDAAYGPEMSAIWDNPAVAERIEGDKAWRERVAAGGSVIDWYRMLNSPHEQELAMRSDFGAAAGAKTPANSGRRYLAYWETRNLRMVANVREVIGPGRRVLAIVGASHKAYYERYLGMTSDVVLADVDIVLGE